MDDIYEKSSMKTQEIYIQVPHSNARVINANLELPTYGPYVEKAERIVLTPEELREELTRFASFISSKGIIFKNETHAQPDILNEYLNRDKQ